MTVGDGGGEIPSGRIKWWPADGNEGSGTGVVAMIADEEDAQISWIEFGRAILVEADAEESQITIGGSAGVVHLIGVNVALVGAGIGACAEGQLKLSWRVDGVIDFALHAEAGNGGAEVF